MNKVLSIALLLALFGGSVQAQTQAATGAVAPGAHVVCREEGEFLPFVGVGGEEFVGAVRAQGQGGRHDTSQKI